MQKYVIVFFINLDTVQKEFSCLEWPLHITLLANFTISSPVNKLINNLEGLSKQTKPLRVRVEGEDKFGPNRDVHVSLINPNVEIKALHDKLVNLTKELGAQYDEPKYMSKGFRPHATIKFDSQLYEGQIVTIYSFTLVDMYPDNDINRRRLMQTFSLEADKG